MTVNEMINKINNLSDLKRALERMYEASDKSTDDAFYLESAVDAVDEYLDVLYDKKVI